MFRLPPRVTSNCLESVNGMNTYHLRRTARVLLVLIGVSFAPALVFAQHAGGGFHVGGAYAGGAGYGWHGGYGWYGGHGWHGGYGGHAGWGYPYYGVGWGFSIGFSWGYPYAYGYGAWATAPYYYAPYYYAPYYAPCCYGPYGYVRGQAAGNGSDPEDDWATGQKPVSGGSAGNAGTNAKAKSQPDARANRSQRPDVQEMSSYRRPVQNAIRALLAMPPDARRRQLESARYANFSAAERVVLAQVSFPK